MYKVSTDCGEEGHGILPEWLMARSMFGDESIYGI